MPELGPDDQYKNVVSVAHGYLKARGYLKSGARFSRLIDGNRVIVQFQKSAWNSADSKNFTVNFAVVSSHLARSQDGEDPAKLLNEWQGHARARIGRFQSRPGDKWWTLDATNDADVMIAELMPLLRCGTEFFETNASDAALAALWRDSVGPEPSTSRYLELRVAVAALVSG